MMQTIIGNLIGNAVKFSFPKGTITVSARELPEDQIEISVADRGVGISETNQQKLFRLDAKLQRKGTRNEAGTGLGLILSRELIVRQGGNIAVRSEEGEGSTFTINILKADQNETN